MKFDITESTHDCLATVRKIPLASFRWKDLGNDPWKLREARQRSNAHKIVVGMIAQDVQKVFHDGVIRGEDYEERLGRVWQLDHNNMLALVIGTLKQIDARLTALEARL